jgi:Skp family chaperone for outer membrane proteins
MRKGSSVFLSKMIKSLVLFVVVLGGASATYGLEIPLKGASGQGGVAVGYVDMEAIFQEYPETKRAKNEYYRDLAKRREALAQRERDLEDLRQRLGVLRQTLGEGSAGPSAVSTAPAAGLSTGTAPVSGLPAGAEAAPAGEPALSTASVAAGQGDLLARERELTEKEAQLLQARTEAAKALRDFEEKRSLQILGKLYNELVKLAEESGVSLVVDKSSILYGHNAIDLTDRLRRRIRGLPETEPE